MHIDVRLNRESSGVEEVIGTPRFVFREIYKITHYANGGIGASYNGNAELKFGIKEWAEVVAAKGDLSILGIHVIKDAPVPDMDEYIQRKREHILQDWR